jgi:hypothetical protein
MADQPGNEQSPAGDTETQRITTIDDLKTEQARQAGVLDELLSLVKGGEREAHGAAQQHVEHRLDDPGHLDEIKKAIRDVNAEQAAAQAQAAHDAEHGRLRQQQAEPEKPPREAMQTWKAKLQHRMFDGGERQ